MMSKPTSVDALPIALRKLRLHRQALDILFENRCQVRHAFSDLKGLYGITHMSVAVIDPSWLLMAFSSTPNIEYNLFYHSLWKRDPCYILPESPDSALVWWDYSDQEIQKVKLTNNRFALGMTVCRKVRNFHFLYSFATSMRAENLREFYSENVSILLHMGDYFYTAARPLHTVYADKHVPPLVDEFYPKGERVKLKPHVFLLPTANTVCV